MPVVLAAAARVALLDAGGEQRRQRAREQREDVHPGRGQVDVAVVAVREARHAAQAPVGPDAEHVWERGRVARPRPRLLRRVVAVANSRDDERSLPDGELDRPLLGPGEAVDARVARVARAAEAEVDHARALLNGPADRARLRPRRDRAVVADDLRHHQARRRREARDPRRVVRDRRDLARDERAVTEGVDNSAADEAAVGDDAVLQLGMAEIDAGVDHRDPYREQLLGGVEGVKRVVAAEVPLAREVLVVRRRRERGTRRPRDGQRERGDGQQAPHACTTVSTGERPAAKPLPATTRAR